MATTAPSLPPEALALVDTVGIAGTGVAAAVGALLLVVYALCGSKNRFGFNKFDALFLAAFVT